ncbi:MAG TPA: rod shape-determining protein RodA, partial [Sulfuricurvum sp.]|nr:rod shape-determining protein RodA [Sulfuricurvum sp.]
MRRIDRRILAHVDFVSVALLIPLVTVSGWLIGEIHPVLAHKYLVYVGVGIVV